MIAESDRAPAPGRTFEPRHVALVCANTVRYTLRTGAGIIFTLAVVYFGVAPCAVLLGVPLSDMADFVNENVTPQVNRVLGGGSWSNDMTATERARWEAADRWRVHLMKERPLILTLDLAWLSVLMPLLCCLGTFSVLADDTRSLALRFDLMRTSRTSLYLGRYLGTVLFTCAALVVSVLLVVVYLGFTAKEHAWGTLAAWGARGLLEMIAVAPAYVALGLSISARIDSPFGALLTSELVVLGVPLFALLGARAWEPLGYMAHLLPLEILKYFFHPQPLYAAGAAVACLGYAVVFLGVGLWSFRRRDL